MDALLQALQQFGESLPKLVSALAAILLPWTPLAAWLGFWLFAVDWVRLREILIVRSGWIGLVLIGAVMVLVWGVAAPESVEPADFFGLRVSHFVERTVYVTGLFCLMFLAGALQLSGCCASCCHFEEPAPDEEAHGIGGHH